MLIRLLRQFLRPYARQILAVVVLQLFSVSAMLYLPKLYGEIVDNGIPGHKVDYMLQTGALMLAITLGQVVCATPTAW